MNNLNSKKKCFDDLIKEQMLYYHERADEFDEYYERAGQHDHGTAYNNIWNDELNQILNALNNFLHSSDQITELACGTGYWTKQLALCCRSVVALDSSLKMIEINQRKNKFENIEFIQADIYKWKPNKTYDVVFFCFWLSHIHPDKFDSFWALVKSLLRPEGRVFFVDNKYYPSPISTEDFTVKRRLNDSREFQIIKILYESNQLICALENYGFNIQVKETDKFFMYGFGKKNI